MKEGGKMRAQLKISFSNIKRKKLRNILTYITFAVAALIFATGLAMFTMSKDPFDKTIKELKTSHTLLYYDPELYEGLDLKNILENQEEVEGVNQLVMCYMDGKASYQGKTIDTYLTLVELPSKPVNQDMLQVFEGGENASLGENEVWISNQFANANKIKAGDILELPARGGIQDYKVSAIVVDPHYSIGKNNPTRVWVKEGEIKRNFSEQSGYVLGIRYKNYTDEIELKSWNDFEKSIGKSFGGYKKGYRALETAYKNSYTNVGLVLVLFSIIIVVFCIVLLIFTISDAVLVDYSIIGIYRAQGFKAGQITFSYMLQYLIGAFVAVPLGCFGSIPIINILDRSLISTMGKVRTDSMYAEPFAITFLVFVALIVIVTFISARRVSSIKPSQAIRYGAPATKIRKKASINASKIKKLPLFFILALNELLSRKRIAILTLFSVFITSLILSSGITLVESYQNALSDPALIGWDWSDLTISNSFRTDKSNDDVYNLLKSEENIEEVIPLTILMNSSFYINNDQSMTATGYAYDGNMDSVKVTNLEGRNPENAGEISISTGLSEKTSKVVGDKISVKIEGVDKELTVTGTFFTMSSNGYLFRVQQSAVEESQIGFSKVFQVKLKNADNLDEYVEQLKAKYPEMFEIQVNKTFIASFFSTLMSVVELIAMLIVVIVVIVCFITIYNSSTTNIFNMKKEYGIFKTLGISTNQINRILLYKTALVAGVGAIIGALLGIKFPEVIIKPSLVEIGFTKFDVIPNWPFVIAVIPFCIIMTCLSVLASSRRIIKINPKNLVNE